MFTVRVYGIYINDDRQILVSDELIKGELFTKFPGGGLEFGEGTRECLVREFKEEMSNDIVVKEHLYTTDFYVESAFKKGMQVISIYYKIDFIQPIVLPVINEAPTMATFLKDNQHLAEKHRLIDEENLVASVFQLPIDKAMVDIIKEQYF